jgi:L-serine dehydratase
VVQWSSQYRARVLVSVFDLFNIGIGPSSSHTIGPMRAAAAVATRLNGAPVASMHVTLYGSLALTCRGHGTDRALLAGFRCRDPETVDPAELDEIDSERAFTLGEHKLPRDAYSLVLQARGAPPGHPNAMRFTAATDQGAILLETVYRSIGGGFITEDGVAAATEIQPAAPYATATELVEHAENLGGFAEVARCNESQLRSTVEIEARLTGVLDTMDESIERGLRAEGELPGGLRVRRRASGLHHALRGDPGGRLHELEWVALWAMAVNEENAAGGRVVTAPTNGASGVLPAVIRYARVFEDASASDARRMLLTAAAVGALIKRNASISGAEVGCQGEVGSAAAMAAAALAEVLAGTPPQVANAAEIALEHHLGMTCDPVSGLVQVPCIERNAIAAAKAITAAKLALRGDGNHVVSLDQAIDAMRRTGVDMRSEYKETSRGGLAVSVPAC